MENIRFPLKCEQSPGDIQAILVYGCASKLRLIQYGNKQKGSHVDSLMSRDVLTAVILVALNTFRDHQAANVNTFAL